MADNREISHADFVAACCTVAAVLADGWWKDSKVISRSIERPGGTPSAAMDCQAAAKYCGFGRTKFRQLVTESIFPQPITIDGRKRWLAKDLDAALARLGKAHR